MTISLSPPISLSDLVTEFGGTAPHSLSEYYRGGTLVPDTPVNASVPSSGAMNLSQFYGSSDANVIFSGNKRGETIISGGDDYSRVRTADWVDTNGATWNIRQWLQGASSGKTDVSVNANVASSYWTSIIWNPSTIVNEADTETFTAWNGSVTNWRFDGDVFDINGHTTGFDTTFVILGA